MSVFILWFSTTFGTSGFFRWNRNTDASIVKRRIMIPPAVIILFRNFSCLQLGRLLLPSTEPLLKIRGTNTSIKDLRTKTDQTIHIRDAKQLAILQRKKRVHQSIHRVYIRHSDRFGRNIQCFRQLSRQICLWCAILRFILRQTNISRVWRKTQHKSQILLRHPPVRCERTGCVRLSPSKSPRKKDIFIITNSFIVCSH